MKCFTSYKRCSADTINGESIILSTRYTTFDKQEMDDLEENLKKTIGSGVMMDIRSESEE